MPFQDVDGVWWHEVEPRTRIVHTSPTKMAWILENVWHSKTNTFCHEVHSHLTDAFSKAFVTLPDIDGSRAFQAAGPIPRKSSHSDGEIQSFQNTTTRVTVVHG